MGLSDAQTNELIEAAQAARENAYAPFSDFKVGAALLSADGEIFTGVNVENSSYGLTICAERVAVCRAVAEGIREFTAIAIVTDGGGSPCGACRQFMYEFGGELQVVLVDATSDAAPQRMTLASLLPSGFRFSPPGS